MPADPNPFTAWLPMYGPEVLPERPWWSRSSPRVGEEMGYVYRCDHGPFLYHRIATLHVRETPPYYPPKTREELLAEIDAYDAAHPLPAPPPMAGQVWAFGETQRVVVTVLCGVAWFQHEVGRDYPADRGVAWRAVEANGATVWPPVNGVLVAGPTPWGRDRPWAPVGWRP